MMLDLQTKLSNALEIMLIWQGSSILKNYEKNKNFMQNAVVIYM